MPRLALALVLVWFLSLFVLRTAIQWWRTGNAGMRGFSGRVGSLEWNAGALVSLGFAAGMLTPLATLAGWPGGTLWFANDALHWIGAGVVSVGIAGALAAQISMGDSWRIGVDASETTELVTAGLFAWVRNPIFSFLLLTGIGLAALLPTTFSLLALVLTAVGIEIQVRAVEEPYLEKAHGAVYREYAARVGRLVPCVGRINPRLAPSDRVAG